MIILPKQVEFVLQTLEDNGHEGFVVGGCVRDFLCGRLPDDIDIATNATPNIVMKIFSNYKIVETGLKYGTVTVIIQSLNLEITTYRIDGDYSDNRRPEKVCYTKNIKEDLARRDFTINAIAYHPRTGFVDPFGGKSDIDKKIIKTVGIPQKQFEEDSLRILRGLRFAAVLGFDIEKRTFDSMRLESGLLKNISVERVYGEFCKIILGDYCKNVFEIAADIVGVIIPEVLPMIGFNQNNPHHIYDVWVQSLVAMENVSSVLYLKLVAFFHDVGKPEVCKQDKNGVCHFYGHAEKSVQITERILGRLRCDNITKRRILTLIKYHDVPLVLSDKSIKKWLGKLSPQLFFDLLTIKKADNLAQNSDYYFRQSELEKIEDFAKKIIEKKECFSLKDLQINGNDLVSLGYQGEEIGMKLNCILKKVIDGQISNVKTELISVCKMKNDL